MSIRTSARALSETAGRFAAISLVSLGIASYANLKHHRNYWEGTIHRVQTVDFNMLSHMLPTKLSQALIERDSEEIQRTLDSNYGLFGLVVTDCRTARPDCDQRLLYVSKSNHSWRNTLSRDTLANSAYDVLRDPIPIHPTGAYNSSRDASRRPTGLRNEGRIIGRVYYIRGVPPGFLQTYYSWIRDWPSSFLSHSGPNRYYALTVALFSMGGFSAWCFLELGLRKKKRQLLHAEAKNEQIARSEQALKDKSQQLYQQLQVEAAEKTQLIERYRSTLQELENSQTHYHKQESELQSSLQKLKAQLAVQTKQHEQDHQHQTQLKIDIQKQREVAEALQARISTLQAQKATTADTHKLQSKLKRLEDERKAAQELLKKRTGELEQVWGELETQTKEQAEKAELVSVLSTQLEETKKQQKRTFQEKNELQRSIEEMQADALLEQERIEKLEEELFVERRQSNEYEKVLREQEKLYQQLQVEAAEKTQLIGRYRTMLQELEDSQAHYHRQESELQSSLQNLKAQLAMRTKQHEQDHQYQAQLKIDVQKQREVAEALQARISTLQAQAETTADAHQLQSKLKSLEDERKTAQTLLEKRTVELEQVWGELETQTREQEEKAKQVSVLSTELEKTKENQRRAFQEKEVLQQSIEEMQADAAAEQARIEKLEKALFVERRQSSEYEKVLREQESATLNAFEKKLVSLLSHEKKVKDGSWLVRTQVDVSGDREKSASRFTDCIVIGDSFIVVIEAKNYSGRIQPRESAKESPWLNITDQRKSVEIKSSSGSNPYKQVHTYTTAAISLIERNMSFEARRNSTAIAFYGVVVFPDRADITSVEHKLGNYYKVAQLSNLPDVLHKIDTRTRRRQLKKGLRRFSANEIDSFLRGNLILRSG